MAVFGKILGIALAATTAFGLCSSASAAVQIATLNGGNTITVPPSVQYATSMDWLANGADTGVVQFTLGSALTLNAAGFGNTGIGANIFNFGTVHLYAGNYQANGNSVVGLTQVSTVANESIVNVPGTHFAWLTPAFLTAGTYSLVYTGNAVNVNLAGNPGGANVAGNISFEAPVPEAATWMMMVAGFGVMGAAMRRRPRTQVTFA